MRSAPISTEAQKTDFLRRYEQEIRRTDLSQRGGTFEKIGHLMRDAGLYSKKTYIADIAGGLHRRAIDYGWITK